MEFVSEPPTPECRFTVPDRPTVRQQMTWADAISTRDGVIRTEYYWSGVLTLIEDWECEIFPDPRVSLDDVDNPSILTVIRWAAIQAMYHMTGLEDIPKN